MSEPTSEKPVDLLAEWIAMGEEVMKRYYPKAKYGLMLFHFGPDVPDAKLPLIPPHPPGFDEPSPVPSSVR